MKELSFNALTKIHGIGNVSQENSNDEINQD
jgi:hypothetical protein